MRGSVRRYAPPLRETRVPPSLMLLSIQRLSAIRYADKIILSPYYAERYGRRWRRSRRRYARDTAHAYLLRCRASPLLCSPRARASACRERCAESVPPPVTSPPHINYSTIVSATYISRHRMATCQESFLYTEVVIDVRIYRRRRGGHNMNVSMRCR